MARTAAIVLQIAGRPGPAFPLDAAAENVLGRTSGGVVALADRLASRNHAAIRFDGEGWMVVDLGSRNGTWVDGVRVSRSRLVDGSLIRVGTTEFVFRPITAPLPVPDLAGRRVVRRGPAAELEGLVVGRESGADESRWPMLVYQAGLRLLAASGSHDIVCTTLELAAEFTAASGFAWLEPDPGGRPAVVCAVPPGSGLPTAVAAVAWQDAVAGRAVWLAADAPADGDVACVPLLDGGRVLAVLAAGGGIREADFEFLLSLARLAAAARLGRGAAVGTRDGTSDTTEPLADDAVAGDDGLVAGTVVLSAGDLEQLHGGLPAMPAAAGSLRLSDWERMLIIEALRRTGGSVPEAATLLGISRATLYRRLGSYGLTRDGTPPPPA